MKRFVGTLVALVVLFVAIVVVMHVVAIVRLQDKVDAAYTLTPDQEYLFLGSSQVGCGIEEAPQWRNKVLWVSDTTLLHSLVRLKELERRGQLKSVKKVVLPFNFVFFQQYSERTLKWGWYQELPVAIHHWADYPFSTMGFLAYVACNLRWPFHMQAKSGYPVGRPAIRTRPSKWQEKFMKDVEFSGRNLLYGGGDGWQELLRLHFSEFKNVCDRNGLGVVVFRMPVLPQWRNVVSCSILKHEEEWFRWLERLGVKVVRLNNELKYNDGLFFDMVHLMETGTRVFTKEIFGELCHVD